MAKKLEVWQASDGKQFTTEVEAEYWDRLCSLVIDLAKFYDSEEFDVDAAAKWLLDTYTMTELP